MCPVRDFNQNLSEYTPETLTPFSSMLYLPDTQYKVKKKTDECSDVSKEKRKAFKET
jgi:hypothetical protein